YDLTATFTTEAGGTAVRTGALDTEPLPDGILPMLSLLALDSDRTEPGLTVLPCSAGAIAVVFAVDVDGAPVWVWDVGAEVKSVHLVDGVFGGLAGDGVIRWTVLGEVVEAWAPPEDAEKLAAVVPVVHVVPARMLHHDVVFQPDGS